MLIESVATAVAISRNKGKLFQAPADPEIKRIPRNTIS